MSGFKRTSVHLGQADVVRYLQDRQWRSLTEITRGIGDLLPPEKASRYAEKALSLGRTKSISDDHGARVATGRREMVRVIVSSSMAAGKVESTERFNHDTLQMERVFRLSQWFCWSCGVRQTGDLLPEKMCTSCVAASNNEE